MAEWLARRTHDLLIAGSSPTGALGNILGQDMNPVGTPAMLTVKRSATCSTRGGSQGTYITFASAMRIRQPALALKPRGDVTRNPKQGYQWPQNRTCVCVCQKYFKKKKKKKKKKGNPVANSLSANLCSAQGDGHLKGALSLFIIQTYVQLYFVPILKMQRA